VSNQATIPGFEQIYQDMFAGAIANHDDDVYQSIVLNASGVLNTDRVHVGVYESGDLAYFFAAPSTLFGSMLDFSTPLVAAVPGHPEHQGDGAYVISQGKISVAALHVNRTLRLICNDTDKVMETIADMELKAFYPAGRSSPLLIESSRGRLRRLGDKFSRKTTKYATIVAMIGFMIAALGSLAETAFSTTLSNANEKNAEELNGVVAKLEYSSPLSQQIGQLNKLSATVVRAGGWIDEYHLKAGRETFVVSLPEWVTQDYIVALGAGAVADKDSENNIIKVVKK
jgi:hypothetical protein